jgi:hypothetical protein
MSRYDGYGPSEAGAVDLRKETTSRVPYLSDVPYLCRYVTEELKTGPAAPQGPSDDELNRITPDPYLLPFGGSTSLFSDLIMGPLMSPGRATSVIQIETRKK